MSVHISKKGYLQWETSLFLKVWSKHHTFLQQTAHLKGHVWHASSMKEEIRPYSLIQELTRMQQGGGDSVIPRRMDI